MSQFRDTFTKEGNNESALDYDDNAFIFFGSTVLLCILVPWTFSLIRWILFPKVSKNADYPMKSNGNIIKYCDCSFCKKKLESGRRSKRNCSNRLNASVLLQLLINAVLWGLFIYSYGVLSELSGIHRFDPFEVLGVDSSATVSQIKKAFRLLSLKHHPDANPNDPTAAAKFLLLSKAMRILTDETAKSNYERYGNPDGPSAMRIGIGLPRFLIQKEYQLLNLSIFFVILLVVIPFVFISYYQRQKRYGPNGVQVDTVRLLYYIVTDGTRVRNFPEILAACAESCAIPLKSSDNDDMKKLLQNVQDAKKRMFSAPIVVRNYFLVLAHLQRLHDIMSPSLTNVLNQMLRSTKTIIPTLVRMCIYRDWVLTAKSALDFNRSLIQAIYFQEPSLLQIPHFDASTISHCTIGKNAVRHLQDFLTQPPQDRKGLNKMKPSQLDDINAFCAHVSNMEVTASVAVEDEEEIVVGDVATCYITLTRKNLKKGEVMGPVHSTFYPEVKFEEWWIFITNKNGQILGYIESKKLDRVVEEQTKFEVSIAGKQTLNIYAMCDSYLGIDQSITVDFTAYPEGKVDRTFHAHPEDVELDNELTMFQQMMKDNAEDYSSDEEEEDIATPIDKLSVEKIAENEVKEGANVSPQEPSTVVENVTEPSNSASI